MWMKEVRIVMYEEKMTKQQEEERKSVLQE
jgi:hypothetical protein